MIRRIAPVVAVVVVPFTFALLASRDRTAAATPPLPTATIATSTVMVPVATVPTVIKQPILPVTITFDNVASGTIIDTAYTGLTFAPVTMNAQGALVPIAGGHIYAVNDPTAVRAPCAFSGLLCNPVGGNVATMNPPTQLPWIQGAQGAIQVKFATGKAWVSVMARPTNLPETTSTNEPYLVAYGPSGYLGEAVYTLPVTTPPAVWGSFQPLVYNAPAGQTISFVLLSTQQRGGPPVLGEFDNLSYPQ